MTGQKSPIDALVSRMSVAFQRVIDAGTIREYRDTLNDLPVWAVEAAFKHLRQRGGDFMPTAARWHETAVQSMRDEQRRLDRLATLNTRPRPSAAGPHCPTCRDFGWVEREDDAGDRRVYRCGCRASNPVIQQREARERVSGEPVVDPPQPTAIALTRDFKQLSSGE